MKSKPLVKKIVSGKYRGTIVKLPSKTTTRSSKNIVLESFFNTIQFDIIESTFVELFSGSGSIGLEALSRGSSKVIFMEKDAEAVKILKQNIDQTDPSSCEVFRGDTFKNIDAVVSRLQNLNREAYFYIDPPFSIREGMEDIYEKMLKLISELPNDVVNMIIVEHMSTLELPQTIGSFTIAKSKKFGNSTLTYFKIQ